MTDGKRLSGEVMLVTGGSNGIGRAVVERAVAEGAAVAVLDLEAYPGSPGRAAGGGPGAGVHSVVCDVTDESAIGAAVDEVAAALGPVSVLVNCAGKNAYGDVGAMTSAEWDAFFALDLKAAWLCARAVLPHMRSLGRGAIVTVASVHAHLTSEGYFPYAAAKSGLLGLSRSMALDLGPENIRVNTVSPGYTLTRLVDEYLDQLGDRGRRDELDAKHALRRMGRTEEVAAVICFLASAEASFVTGADWIVDGGLSARFA